MSVNGKPLLDIPFTVTTTLPGTAPTGTVAVIAVLIQFVVDAVTPVNVTEPDVPKLLPVIVTDWPIPPGLGEIEEIVGFAATAKAQARRVKTTIRQNLCINRSTPNTSTGIQKSFDSPPQAARYKARSTVNSIDDRELSVSAN